MSYYGVVFPEYWDGVTGRAIARHGGGHALLLGAYLMSCRNANMIGLYYLPLDPLPRLLCLNARQLPKAFAALEAEQFAFYDSTTEYVWVREMARFRVGLRPDRPALDPDDNKVAGVNKVYRLLAENPFLGPFFDRYQKILHLEKRRTGPTPHKMLALEGPNKGLMRGLKASKQISGTRDQDQESGDQEGAQKNRAPTLHPIREVLTTFDESYLRQFQRPYVRTNNGQEAKIAQLLVKQLPVAEILTRLDRFLVSRKDWYVKTGHSFWCFVKAINELAEPQAKTISVDVSGIQQWLESES